METRRPDYSDPPLNCRKTSSEVELMETAHEHQLLLRLLRRKTSSEVELMETNHGYHNSRTLIVARLLLKSN